MLFPASGVNDRQHDTTSRGVHDAPPAHLSSIFEIHKLPPLRAAWDSPGWVGVVSLQGACENLPGEFGRFPAPMQGCIGAGKADTGRTSDDDPVRTGVNLLEGAMKSLVTKRSIVIAGHKTSVSLERWHSGRDSRRLRRGARHHPCPKMGRRHRFRGGRAGNLSSAIRLFVLDHYRTMIGATAGTQGLSCRNRDTGSGGFCPIRVDA